MVAERPLRPTRSGSGPLRGVGRAFWRQVDALIFAFEMLAALAFR